MNGLKIKISPILYNTINRALFLKDEKYKISNNNRVRIYTKTGFTENDRIAAIK